ncbi:MAG: glycosyltransferase [Lachnospiraceae bacterium]|nr:glycosyltransferase [Lachnospiraceae bacterium]
MGNEGKKVIVDIVCPTGGNKGGVENVLKKWTKYIDHEKYDLRLFHCHEGIAYLEEYEKAYCMRKPYEKADVNYLANAYATFVKEKGAPDICIANNWPMMVYACAYVKNFFHLDSMKLVSWIHNQIAVYEKEGLGGAIEVSNADYHFAISHGIADEIKAVKADAKIFEIGNPVDFPKVEIKDTDKNLLCYVGRLDEVKRVELILEALSKTKNNWKLKIVGDGERKNEILEWIEAYGLESRVQMLGWSKTPWQEVEDASICILASEYEGFALSAFEASSSGKTVISTPVFGVAEYIKEGENGYLFPFGDVISLVNILDDISDGKRKICNPKICAESVKEYETSAYFKKVMNVLDSISNA